MKSSRKHLTPLRSSRKFKDEQRSTRKRRTPQGANVVICGSMSFYPNMVEQQSLLRALGVKSVIPSPDTDVFQILNEEESLSAKRSASMKHIRRVRDGKTFGILVLNFDKHGIADYIGANSFAEIAVALAHYKRIYLYQGVPTFYRDELIAWGAVPLNCDLSRLVDDIKQYENTIRQLGQQMTLFDT